jgi:hypothetical protein
VKWPPYPGACCGFSFAWACGVGNVGNGESRFDEKNSGDEGYLNNGAVALRRGFMRGEFLPSTEEPYTDGEALIGVN